MTPDDRRRRALAAPKFKYGDGTRPTMFDAPMDTLPVWVGVAAVSLAVFGIATSLPTSAPGATAVADTVDAVAASPHDATATQPVAADRVRLSPYRVTVVAAGDASHDTFAYAPVTPVGPDTPLASVLAGTPPDQVFDTPRAFVRATRTARTEAPVTLSTDTVQARRVAWGGANVTLVG